MWIILPVILIGVIVASISKSDKKKKEITEEEQDIIENVAIVQPIIRKDN